MGPITLLLVPPFPGFWNLPTALGTSRKSIMDRKPVFQRTSTYLHYFTVLSFVQKLKSNYHTSWSGIDCEIFKLYDFYVGKGWLWDVVNNNNIKSIFQFQFFCQLQISNFWTVHQMRQRKRILFCFHEISRNFKPIARPIVSRIF